MTFALIGNQNCGKTTLFNQLTGSNQHVGNFPGVTVEKKDGKIRGSNSVIVDLPGIYSLSPYTMEEVVTRDFLLDEKPDGIINIVDATNIERNLYLTLQLLELDMPMVIALNMMDEVRTNGGSIDTEGLSKMLGVPVVAISASKNEGLEELIKAAEKTAVQKEPHSRCELYPPELSSGINALSEMVRGQAEKAGVPLRFAASKLLENDSIMAEKLGITADETAVAESFAKELEEKHGMDREAALADMRYSYIENMCDTVVTKQRESREQIRSFKIDMLLTHKYLGIPLFLGVMLLVFYLTFGVIGEALSGIFTQGIDAATAMADLALTQVGINPLIHSLVIDGIFAGVGAVLGFMPTIVTLFFFLSLLEDSGYMARVAFIMDKLLRKIGLSGRSFVPMVIGFGCSVPAIMATRTLPSLRDRRMTIMLIPFMSCSAKLPIYGLFTAAFFPDNAALVMMSLYVGGMAAAVISGLMLRNSVFKGDGVPFVMELPAYRLPAPRSVMMHMYEKARDFVVKAFTIIFAATIIVWILQHFSFDMRIVQDSENSMLATLGKAVAPIFAPLGFGDWRAVAALVTGLGAKEAVVSTLAVLMNVTNEAALIPMMSQLFTPLAALSFLTFTLLYMPCVAALAATKRELGGKWAGIAMAYQTGFAWVAAFMVYNIGRLIGF